MRALGTGPESAAWPTHEALAEAIEGFPALAGVRVWNAAAGPNAELPYVVIGATSEETWRLIMTQGGRLAIELHVWHSDTLTSEGVLSIYRHLRRLLHGTALPVDGFRVGRTSCELVTFFVDRDSDATHAVVRYEIDASPLPV